MLAKLNNYETQRESGRLDTIIRKQKELQELKMQEKILQEKLDVLKPRVKAQHHDIIDDLVLTIKEEL